VNRLKSGPANIPEVIYDDVYYNDGDFSPPNSLFWNGYEDDVEEANIDDALALGTYTWDSWN
jgi:hypothetical protein